MHLFSILNRSLVSTSRVCDFGRGEKCPDVVLHVYLQPCDLALELNKLLSLI